MQDQERERAAECYVNTWARTEEIKVTCRIFFQIVESVSYGSGNTDNTLRTDLGPAGQWYREEVLAQCKKEILLRDLIKQNNVLPRTEVNADCTGRAETRAGGPLYQRDIYDLVGSWTGQPHGAQGSLLAQSHSCAENCKVYPHISVIFCLYSGCYIEF